MSEKPAQPDAPIPAVTDAVTPTPRSAIPRGADIRLVVADMDGTLLDLQGQIPERTWELIAELRRRGIIFAPASGRQYATLREMFAQIAEGMVFIAENGANVVRDGQLLDSTALDNRICEEVVRRIRAIAARSGENSANADVGVVRCGTDTAYIERHDPDFVAACAPYYRSLTQVPDLLEVDSEVVKVAVYDFGDIEAQTVPALLDPPLSGAVDGEHTEAPRVVISGRHWTDIMSSHADKGVALAHLQRELGITPAQTVVCGDYLNDAGLFDNSELGVAMANGHPEIIARAQIIAPSNAENGFAQVLTALLAE